MAKLLLSKRQRHSMYKKALQVINKDIESDGYYNGGLCYAMKLAIQRQKAPSFCEEPNEYPELFKHKPAHVEHHPMILWFPANDAGDVRRIGFLTQAIAETAPKSKQ